MNRERAIEAAAAALKAAEWTYLPRRDEIIVDAILRTIEEGDVGASLRLHIKKLKQGG